MSWRALSRFNAREHVAVYILASISNILLTIPQYLAVYSAVHSYLPVQGSTAGLIARYGVSLGVVFDFIATVLVFQGILAVLVLTVAASSNARTGWRWLYALSAAFVTGYVGYWLGAKFLRDLEWVSLLQNSGIDSSGVYSSLFWFGLGATICYVGMILVLRKSYGKLTSTRLVAN